MGAFWSGRKVLVTGHTGFKGAWLALWLQELGARVSGLALPPEDPVGTFAAFDGSWQLDSWFVDIRDQRSVSEVLASVDPEAIFHLSAQSLVRRGYAEPFLTYATNTVGTMNLLHAARLAPSLQAIVVVTSDKVYRHQYGGAVAFREGDELGGDDPYSGSKALAELIVQACRETCLANSGVSIATARAGNVIGGGDRGQDRLLPDAWRAIEANETLLVRNPHAVRPWQFVLEPLHGYMLLAERLATRPADVPAAINFGPDAGSTETVAGLLDRLFALWGPGDWRVDASSRLTEAECLRLDSSLARHTLGWRPRLSLDEALEWTMEWWRKSLCSDNLYELAIRQLHAYEALLP